MADARLTAGLAVLEEIYDGLIGLVETADEALFDWKPSVPETNSTAVLIKHLTASTESWLGRALDQPPTRDRDAEFRFKGSREELLSILTESRATIRDQFSRLEGVDPAIIRSYARLNKPDQNQLSVAWCIEHALVHAAEHWGQIQLNQHLFAAH